MLWSIGVRAPLVGAHKGRPYVPNPHVSEERSEKSRSEPFAALRVTAFLLLYCRVTIPTASQRTTNSVGCASWVRDLDAITSR